jgi:uncharacterized integral membrane protein
MIMCGQGSSMAALIVLGLFVVGVVLSVAVGGARDLDDRDRRGWWPGASRR